MSEDLADIAAAVDAALARRTDFADDPELDAYRLVHGWSEGIPRVEIDRWGPVVTIDTRESALTAAEAAAAHLSNVLAPDAVVIRARGLEPRLYGGDDPGTVVVREGPMQVAVEPMRPRNPGLFLDARDARTWIRQNSDGRRVLNLFAFTGSLGLAATQGGARQVVHVDSQASALTRLRRNYQLNGFDVDDRDLARLNVYQHLRKRGARRQRYDAVIIDAPPYAPHKDRTPGQRGPIALARLASEMLAPDGWMLCFFHHLLEPRQQLEAAVQDACGGGLDVIWRGQSGADFPEAQDVRKSRMTAFQMVR